MADEPDTRAWLTNDKHEPVTLTPGEVRVLEALGRGHKPDEAAADLGISPNTVYTQLSRIGKKLGTQHWFQSFLRWQQSRAVVAVDGRVSPLIAKLDAAEETMREVMLVPIVTKFWPVVVPELTEALKKLAAARDLLRAPAKIDQPRRSP